MNARQDPPLRIEVDSLEKSVLFLHERLQVLEERLHSVLQEPQPECEKLCKDMSGNSALTRKVYEITTAINSSSLRIQGLIDRLEV